MTRLTTYVAVYLRIQNFLVEGPKTNAELANARGSHNPSLYRLLHALITLAICQEHETTALR